MDISRFLQGPLRDSATGEGDGGDGNSDTGALTEERVNELIQTKLDATAANLRQDFKKALNKSQEGITASLDEIKAAITPQEEDPDDNRGGDDNLTPEARARIQEAEKTAAKAQKAADELKEKYEQAEAKRDEQERKNAVLSEIGNYELRDGASDLAFKNLFSDVRRDDDGNLVGGPEDEAVPVKDFVKSFFEGAGAIYIKPAGSGGSGNSGADNRQRGDAIDLDQIVPGMDEKTRQKAWEQVKRLQS